MALDGLFKIRVTTFRYEKRQLPPDRINFLFVSLSYYCHWRCRFRRLYLYFRHINRLSLPHHSCTNACFDLEHVFTTSTALQSGFQQLPPIVMSPTGTHHHHTTAIFKSLSACGVDVVELKRSIAITLLKFRARVYRAIYDASKTPRSDVDYSLSPPPRSSERTACARSSALSTPAFTDPAPAPANWPMDTG